MRSGVGASWHSILNAPVGHGGSAFGGQPPVLPLHEPLWQSIETHADLLKLRFIRLEFEWRQFEPRRREFTWDSPEMRILDRICAWAERSGADVMLQQQWGGRGMELLPGVSRRSGDGDVFGPGRPERVRRWMDGFAGRVVC
ncbi:MAG: hypothetical protein WC205_14160 [Opitutaceae bacterium]|jgi:hypothetical protein